MRSLDWYYGRPLVSIDDSDRGWQVELTGGVLIINTDPSNPSPDIPSNIVSSLAFAMAIYDANSTLMVLQDKTGNEWRINLNPTQYQIYDPKHSDDGSFTPQMPVERQPKPIIPPHPDERIAEGPEKKKQTKKGKNK